MAAVLSALVYSALAHEHHEELSEEQQNAPVDAILWIHIFLQIGVWGVLFPTGMVLGMSKSRWHVPLQVRLLCNYKYSIYINTHSHRLRVSF